MIYALFSDLHADEAGAARLKEHEAFRSADKRVCLGDAINAHEPHNAERIFHKVCEMSDEFILGNHEAALIGKYDVTTFNPKIGQAVVAAKMQFETESPNFLAELSKLPPKLTIGKAYVTHASFNPEDPWQHIRYTEDVQAQAEHLPARVQFVGHGHIPFIAWLSDGLWYYQRQIYTGTFELEPEKTYVINTGSILGSREMRHFEKTFLTYDDARGTVSFYNLEA